MLNELENEKCIDYDFNLTAKGRKELKDVKLFTINDSDLDQLVEEYRNCFLDENGKPLKPGVTSSRILIKTRLKEFIDTYDYSQEDIIKAVRKYIKSERSSGFRYLQKAHYTIKKKVDGVFESRLLTHLEELEDGEDITFGHEL